MEALLLNHERDDERMPVSDVFCGTVRRQDT